jgi:hypothetical protein
MEVSKMDVNTFIVTVFAYIDDWLHSRNLKLRKRGPKPTLHDSEVLTIEIAGAFLGMNTDKGVFIHFKRHYSHYFPALSRIDRTTYVRQSANLWMVKAHFWQDLLQDIVFDPAFSIVDSMPLPVCRFARANRCRRLRDISAYGHDEVARQTFLGVRTHLHICWPGVIVGLAIAPADVHEMTVAEELLAGSSGWVLADRNYWSPELKQRLAEHSLQLLAPFRKAKNEPRPWPIWLKHKRYRIETVIGQLVERFQAKKVWARDAWHFWSRWFRKVLSHTFAVFLCQQNGLSSLRFAELVTD